MPVMVNGCALYSGVGKRLRTEVMVWLFENRIVA